MAEALGYTESKIKIEKSLYMPSDTELISVINQYSVEFKKIMIVSHNPGLTDFVNNITGENIDNIPTCGVVRIDFNTVPLKINSKGKIIYFEYPKKYRKENG